MNLYRITYKDKWGVKKFIIVREESIWEAKDSGESMFGDDFVICEEIDDETSTK